MNLTYTIATEEMAPLAERTLATFPKDTLVFHKLISKYQHSKYMFFLLSELAEQYPQAEVFQYADSDIFMRGGDIFDRDLDCIWMLDEAEYRRNGNWADQFKEKIEEHTGEAVNWTRHWWNPGVSIIPRQFAKYFVMPPWNVNTHLWNTRSGKDIVKNMPYINWLIAKHGLPIRDLTPYWNCMDPLRSPFAKEANYWHLTQNEHFNAYAKLNILKRLEMPWQPKACLVTVVIGEAFEELAKYTLPLMEEAARRWNMDFKVVRRNKRYPSPSFCKLEYPEDYDVYVFADCDMMILPECPNPIDYVPQGKFGAFNSLTLDYMRAETASWRTSFKEWSARAGYAIPESMPYYINGGFFVCWKECKHILNVPPIDLDGYFEQHGLNHNLWRDDVYFEMDRKWNWGHLHINDNTEGAYIVHLNGVPLDQRIDYFRKVMKND